MNNYLFFFLPIIIGLVSVRFMPLNIKQFQGLYLLFALSLFGIQSYIIQQYSVKDIILCIIAGELIHLLMVGIVGNKLSPSNHASILFGFGLFPWFLGMYESIFYILLFLLVTSIGSFIQLKIATRKYNISSLNPNVIVNQLDSETDIKVFRNKAGVILANYFLIANVLVIILTLIS